MIPNIAFDFNFDYILVLLFSSYILYGYISGGHKQIRLSINLILPFIIIYYLGKYITAYMYVPLSKSFIFVFISELFGMFKYTFSMMLVYALTYILLFIFIIILSKIAKKHVLNENMRAKLGKKNSYIGALFAFINGYVLIYFIILPAFSLNMVDSNAHLTNMVLQNPPPFSRVARTAEKAVPVKSIADKASAFQELLGTDGIEGYYNEAIFEYQQKYIGADNSLESSFMSDVYPHLKLESKQLLGHAYQEYMSELFPSDVPSRELSASSFSGISRVLVSKNDSGKLLYKEVLILEEAFFSDIKDKQEIVADYENVLADYEVDVANYQYQLLLEDYEDAIAVFNDDLSSHLENKVRSAKFGDTYVDVFDDPLPVFLVKAPKGYKKISTQAYPLLPEVPDAVATAQLYLDAHKGDLNVNKQLKSYGTDFFNHSGLLMYYVDFMKLELASDVSGGNIDNAINQFKINFEEIRSNINDDQLEDKLDLAITSIRSYDVFHSWLSCTQENILDDSVSLENLEMPEYRCSDFDLLEENTYDFTAEALALTKNILDGDNVSWYILQYKYDYEADAFQSAFKDFEEVLDILEGMKELSDDYDAYYKEIANSIEGNLSMVFKISISVAKYNLDVYDSLENTPILGAMFNDMARTCSNVDRSIINSNVEICKKTEGDGSLAAEMLNMRYLISEIIFKAYVMVDEENQPIIYDSQKMDEYLKKVNDAVEQNVISPEVIHMLGDQFAFNVIQEGTTLTLLEEMYLEGRISIEAMRILSNDEYELFSEAFRYQVKSLIR